MKAEDFYIEKRNNFIAFINNLCDTYGPGHTEARARKLAELASNGYADMARQSSMLRVLDKNARRVYIDGMFRDYGIDPNKIPAADIEKIHKYLDLFATI